jgi:hypothetical protein
MPLIWSYFFIDCQGDQAEKARLAGADIVGGTELIQQVNQISFFLLACQSSFFDRSNKISCNSIV